MKVSDIEFNLLPTFLIKFEFNPLQPGVAFLYPLKTFRKPLGFLMFSGSVEKQYWTVMG